MKYPNYITKIPQYNPIDTRKDCTFDIDKATDAIDFIQNSLKFVEGSKAGQPFMLEDWQKAIVGNLFGWIRPDGTRRYREAFIFVPRKNGKTPLLAAIMLYICFCDNEPGGQNYSVASETSQASIVYRTMSMMIDENEELIEDCDRYRSTKTIEFKPQSNIFKSLSSDKGGKSKHGQNTHALLVDELHCIEDQEYLDTVTSAQGTRSQPITFYITTAGVYKPNSPCYLIYTYATKIRDGLDVFDFLPVIYELDKGDAWDDEKVWYKCNPNLGVSIRLDYLRKECQKAKEMPSKENPFRRLHLDQWVEQSDRWLPMHKWDKCNEQPSKDRAMRWYGGLDLSINKDLTCFAIVARDDSGRFHAHFYPFIPEDNAVLRERQDKVPYTVWGRDGYLTLTEGNVIDQEKVRKKIKEVSKSFKIVDIAIDKYNATHLMTLLDSDGFEITEYSQGIRSMTGPAKKLEALVLSGKLLHGGHPVAQWCASNVAIETDANDNVKPSKKRSTERIDCVIALIMAIGRLESAEIFKENIYETGGVRSG